LVVGPCTQEDKINKREYSSTFIRWARGE